MGADMHRESPRYRVITYDCQRVARLAEGLIPKGLVFVATRGEDMVGMVAGVVTEHFFSGTKYVSDLILYVRPTFRGTFAAGELVDALEGAGRAQGATESVLGISTEVHAEATAKLYERFGYTRSGISLRKPL